MMTRTRLALGASALVVGSAAAAAQQAAVPQTPVFRTGVELVSVDVGVVDKSGVPIRGLATGDFTVSVNGQPRKVVTAEFMDVSAARAAAAKETGIVPVSSNEGIGVGRLFAFIVDQNTLEPGNIRQVTRAAGRFFDGLSFVDRSALLVMPTGPNMSFTWAHDRVRDALQRVVGLSPLSGSNEFTSLSEARDIANRSFATLRNASMRDCGGASASGSSADAFGPVGQSPSPTQPAGGSTGGGSTGGAGGAGGAGGTTSPGGTQPSGGGSGGSRSRNSNSALATDSCTRDLQMRAEWAWRSAQMTGLASITALRQTLAQLARVPGDKTVVLLSGGWALDEREQTSLLNAVAHEAATARVTIFSMFVPASRDSASRRVVSTTPIDDQWLVSWPLEALAGMTGGGSFRVEVGAETAFDRIGRELQGFYRIGVEKEAGDNDARGRKMKVQVARPGTTVRSREIFDVRTYEDRNWSARLAAALESPIPATAIGLRVTSYTATDPEDVSRLKLVMTGEASRVDPGEATIQLLVRDLQGKALISGEQPVGEPADNGLTFSANLPLPPGNYIVRVAVMDGNGRVGSVDHRVDVKQVDVGPFVAAGPMLVRVPAGAGVQPRLAVGDIPQNERLALQIDLEGNGEELAKSAVSFEIASSNDGPALVQAGASMSPGPRSGWMMAQGVADTRVLPPGSYIARAKVRSGEQLLGELRRPFSVTKAVAVSDVAARSGTGPADVAAPRSIARAVVRIPPFTVDHALSPQVLGAFLDRVAARPDASSPMIRDLVQRARGGAIGELGISDGLAAQYPVAAFLRGLALLSDNRLEHAANAFRGAMRASADFYPAMVYLGVCYAAGGNDKEAAGAWRTALIKESDAAPLHLLLTDALLRQDQGQLALQTVLGARKRWPQDDALKRRFVMAALLAGDRADALGMLDELVTARADDEPTLAAGLVALFEAFETSRPVEDPDRDRARMTRLADAYRTRGGPSLALIDTWLDAAKKR